MKVQIKYFDKEKLIENVNHSNLISYVAKMKVENVEIKAKEDVKEEHKIEEIINENQADMYYAGYVRGYGILDIDHYNKTGDAAYLYDESIETIDREIANLAPDDKRVFEQHMLNYINKYSVSYQIPRVQCPHCRKIMSQREVNMKTLFFEVKAQKGL